jgi:hypothetical protein
MTLHCFRTTLTIAGSWTVLLLLLVTPAFARKWTDATGKYSLEADLIAYDDASAVLKKKNSDLVSVTIAQLSKDDRDYLQAKQQGESNPQADGVQTWTLKSGLKINARIVGYGRRDVIVQRKRGSVFVNDRLFDNLPGVYKRMVPQIVSHFEKIPVNDEKELKRWAVTTKGSPRRYTCEGVLVELENGDEYGVPFFFLSDQDLKVLQPGWDRWTAADRDAEKREQEDFLVQAQAQAYQRDREANKQISHLELSLLATSAGVTSLWEVYVVPRPNVAGMPTTVVVPARDSRQAAAAAVRQYPGYLVNQSRKLN